MCQWAEHFATVSLTLFNTSSQVCCLVRVCGRCEPVLPLSHARIRSNESVKQYLCLLGLFWPGAFHLIRTRCVRNTVFFFFPCQSSPTDCLKLISSVNIWIFRITQQNCVAEQLLQLGALRAGDASADFAQAVINSFSVNAPGAFHGVFLCLNFRRFQCSAEHLRVGGETASLYILLIRFYPLPKSFTRASRDH